MTNTTLTSAQSMTAPSPLQTQPPSIAAVVAANIPPPPRMVVPIHSTVSTAISSVNASVIASVTTAAAVVASGAQSTVATASTVNSGSTQSSGDNGRPYKGSRGDSKVCLRFTINMVRWKVALCKLGSIQLTKLLP